MRNLRGLLLLPGLLCMGVGEARQLSTPTLSVKSEETRMWMIVGERRFAVSLSDNATGRAFAEMLPLTLDMDELNGNEKKVALPKSLPGKATVAGTIRNGDIMLYSSDTLVVFYQTFSSPYSYSRIGRVEDAAGLAQALGQRGVRVQFLPVK